MSTSFFARSLDFTVLWLLARALGLRPRLRSVPRQQTARPAVEVLPDKIAPNNLLSAGDAPVVPLPSPPPAEVAPPPSPWDFQPTSTDTTERESASPSPRDSQPETGPTPAPEPADETPRKPSRPNADLLNPLEATPEEQDGLEDSVAKPVRNGKEGPPSAEGSAPSASPGHAAATAPGSGEGVQGGTGAGTGGNASASQPAPEPSNPSQKQGGQFWMPLLGNASPGGISNTVPASAVPPTVLAAAASPPTAPAAAASLPPPSSTAAPSKPAPTADPAPQPQNSRQSPNSGSLVGIDPALTLLIEGTNFTNTVAEFTDGTNTDPTIYRATIDWGDGTPPSAGTVSYNGSAFVVTGSHVYTEEGSYTATTTVLNTVNNSSTTITSPATVGDAALSWPNGSPTLTWSTNPTASPTITNPGAQSNAEGNSVNLQIAASDPNNYPLTFDALGLPPGLSISTAGLISGTVDYSAAEDFGGSYTATVVVSNGQGGSASTTFTWTVTDTARAPSLTSPGNQSSPLGSSVALQLQASSPDNNILTFDATGLPSGLTIDNTSGLISGTPDASAVSTTPYTVTVTASDGINTATQTFTWTVTAANQTPTFANPGNQSNATGDTVSLSLTGSDSDGDTLTWTATGLPAGLSIDPSSGTLSGTPATSAASPTPYNVTVTASDGSTSASQSFTWAINYVGISSPGDQTNTNGDAVSLPLSASTAGASLSYSATGLPPGLTIDPGSGIIGGTLASTADAGSPYVTTVTASDGSHSASITFNWTVAHLAVTAPGDQVGQEAAAVSLQLQAGDSDHDALTWMATGLPSGLTLSSTGLIAGTLAASAHGSSPYQVTVTASDGVNSASQSFVWTVTPRVALVNPGSQTNASGDSASLQVSASSVGGTLSYSATGLPPGLTIAAATGLISGTIASNASSTPYAVTVTAADGTSSSSQTFLWSVTPIAVLASGDQTNLDGDSVSLPVTTHYHGSGTLSFSATGLPPGLSINAANGTLTGTVATTADTNSPYAVTLTASDGVNSSSQAFNWTINPRVSLDAVADQGNAAGDVVALPLSASDAANAPLTWTASGLPTGLSIDNTGLISGTIATGADTNSPYAVSVTASDGTASVSQTFNWSVAHVALANPGNQTSVDGDPITLALQGRDADGDPVSYSVTGLPPGLVLNPATSQLTGVLAPTADQNSPYLVTLTASEGSHSSSQSFLWYVTQAGLSNPGDQSNTEGDSVTLRVTARGVVGPWTYAAGGLPAGLSLNTLTGEISGTLAAGAASAGPYSVTVAATNGSVSSSQTFTWTVNPRVVLTAPTDQGNVEGNTVALQVTASDTASLPLTYSADSLPPGLSINTSTGLISGTVAAGASSGGPYSVVVTASDSGGYSSSDALTWTVTAVPNTPPTVTNPGTQSNAAGDSIALPVSASDVPGDALTFSATGLPAGLSIDPATGIISGTLATAAASPTPYSVTVTADNGNGGTTSQTFSWIVNDAALTAQATPLSAVEGTDSGSVTLTSFSTPDPGAQASDFTATVLWGDGSSDSGTVAGGPGNFTVSDDHNYLEAGNYMLSVVLTAPGGTTTTVNTTATVTDAPLALTGGFDLGALKQQMSQLTLATFVDGNAASAPSDVTATINWGDGTGTVPGSITFSLGGLASVSGAHVYTQNGSYTVTVTLTDVDGATATTTSTVTVGDLYAGVAATLNLSSFLDANGAAPASDFTATVAWGDGSSTTGILVTASNGTFALPPLTHTYAVDSLSQPGGVYSVTVTITDDGGSTLSGTGTVSVVRPPLALNVTGNLETAAGSLTVTNAEVASFSEPDVTDSSSEFSAVVFWGDGTSSSSTVVGSAGLFDVLGSHPYATAGDYVIQVQVLQSWSAMLAAAQGGGRDEAQPALPQITGSNVVLGVAEKNLAVPVGRATQTYAFHLVLPGANINIPSVKWTPDKPNIAKVVNASFSVFEGKTYLTALVRFLDTPALLNLDVTYKLLGQAAVHKVQAFPISLVQLSVATTPAPVLFHDSNKFRSGNARLGEALGAPAGLGVIATTRPPFNYNPAILKKNPTTPADQDALKTELELGAVSVKATVILKGAGCNQTEGVDRIQLGWLQDVVSSDVTVHYATGTAVFEPKSHGSPMPPPWLDTAAEKDGKVAGSGGSSSFTRSSTAQGPRNVPGGGKSVVVVALDAPGIGWLPTNPKNKTTWKNVTGGWSFVYHLTAYSTAVPNNYLTTYDVIGTVPWSIHFDGTRDPAGLWVKDATKAKVVMLTTMTFTGPIILPGGPKVGNLPAYGAQLASFNADAPTYVAATGGKTKGQDSHAFFVYK